MNKINNSFNYTLSFLNCKKVSARINYCLFVLPVYAHSLTFSLESIKYANKITFIEVIN